MVKSLMGKALVWGRRPRTWARRYEVIILPYYQEIEK